MSLTTGKSTIAIRIRMQEQMMRKLEAQIRIIGLWLDEVRAWNMFNPENPITPEMVAHASAIKEESETMLARVTESIRRKD
jgi:hypothetical protein